MDTVTQPFSLSISISSNRAKAVIALGGTNYEFRAANGFALDAYYDPAGEFIQECVLCAHPALPGYRAYYRPDRASDREEWVFEYGDPWMEPPSTNIAAHTAVITRRDGSQISVSADKGHYWWARWRWQSTPRRVRRTAAQLWEQNLIPHFDPAGLATGGILSVSAYTPMALCGLPADQGQTGGYPGLGVITGWQAQFLTRGAPESSFRNQAEASGSYSAFIRDTRTHAPIDLIDDYPNASSYGDKGNPIIKNGPRVNRTDQGHMPSVTYIPFLLTGDPFYLEAGQFWANQNMLSLPPGTRCMVAGRYLAWPLRAIAECYLATPDNAPSWLLPRSYWRYWLDRHRGYVEERAANRSDPFMWFFTTVQEAGQDTDIDPVPSGDHVWQQGMLDFVAAWIACWDDAWVDPAEWLIHSCINRASATSGWCRERPAPYHMRMQAASVLAEELTATATTLRMQYRDVFKPGEVVNVGDAKNPFEVITLGSATSSDGLTWSITKRGSTPKTHPVKRELFGRKFTNWQETTESNRLVYAWPAESGEHLAAATTDLTYPSYQRCALAQSLHAGLEVPGLREAYDWLDAEMRRLVKDKKLPVGDNWTAMPALTRRRRHRRSDRTDLQLRPDLAEILEAIRGED